MIASSLVLDLQGTQRSALMKILSYVAVLAGALLLFLLFLVYLGASVPNAKSGNLKDDINQQEVCTASS
jgi:hypothetical protein